ncbi:NAD(P)H-binding protein [Streptococcus sp. P25B114]|uniref:NAD(P)H-binding protein n=1 Tax=Streptococcus TaxID=1301 RepID=UPI000CF5317B|nr:NAD(P)H-binding protein [Streptococcus suis]UUM57906.1 NAD(P)H-binding protein [Streptococcus suis]
MSNVLLFGASGFLGQEVMEKLIASGHQLTAITRSFNPENSKKFRPDIDWVEADLYQADQWKELLNDHTVVINLVGMVKEEPEKGLTYDKVILGAAKVIADVMADKSDHHYIYVSTHLEGLATPEGYRKAKKEAEDYLLAQSFKTSIVRPSMMYGPGKAGTNERAQAILEKMDPASPAWAGRPIAVEKVAQTIANIVNGKTDQTIFENDDMA